MTGPGKKVHKSNMKAMSATGQDFRTVLQLQPQKEKSSIRPFQHTTFVADGFENITRAWREMVVTKKTLWRGDQPW